MTALGQWGCLDSMADHIYVPCCHENGKRRAAEKLSAAHPFYKYGYFLWWNIYPKAFEEITRPTGWVKLSWPHLNRKEPFLKNNPIITIGMEEGKMLDNTPDVLTLKEMMKVLRVGKNTALKLIHENVIEGHRVGGKWLVFKEDVEEYILRS